MSINIHSRDENYPQDNHQSQKMNNLIKQKVQNNLKNNLELIPLIGIEKQKILEKADKTTKNILTKKLQLIPTHKVRIDGIDFYF